jgi:alanine-glyoxylate transaminase/serine-glyoxylate transaminase/serine-pyruvate transaminase
MIDSRAGAASSPKLMIPGPVEVDDQVLARMGSPITPHYGSEWSALYTDTTERLKDIFRTAGNVFLIVSSGSGGLEAAISSLFAPADRVLVTVNGFFGQRLANMARYRGLEVTTVTAPWGSPIDPQAVRRALAEAPDTVGLIVVHHETSTGVLNPLSELGTLAQEFDVSFLVDAVSSLGGEDLAMDDWGIDVCVTASQKCLEAPAGLAPVAVSAKAWSRIEANTRVACHPGWYLNLQVWRHYLENWGDWHPTPITMPTSTVLALNTALDCLQAEGLKGRILRYREAATSLRAGLRELGFTLFVDGESASSTITAVRRHPGFEVEDLIAVLRKEYGIYIAGGLGKLSGEVFRVGHMGKAGSQEYVSLLLESVEDCLSRNRL